MRVAVVAVVIAFSLAHAAPAGPMDEELQTLSPPPEPELGIPPRLPALLREALDRPDELTRLEALREAARFGLTELSGRVIELLDDPSPLIRTAALQTLEHMNTSPAPATERLLRFIEAEAGGSADAVDQALIADRLLARLGEGRAMAIWSRRVEEARAPSVVVTSAVRALGRSGRSGEAAVARLLRSVVMDAGRPATVRLAAADTLADLAGRGSMASETMAVEAAAAVSREEPIGPLLAARALRTARSAGAVEVLGRLAAESEDATRAAAMQRLLELDGELLWPIAPDALGSHDPKVRRLAVRALRGRARLETIDLLRPVLDDPHPDVRTETRAALAALAGEGGLRAAVIEQASAVIAGAVETSGGEGSSSRSPAGPAMAGIEGWRAAEQAALLLGRLDHEPAAEALLKLLEHDRLEVRLGAVAALRELNVEATHRPMVELLERTVDGLLDRFIAYSRAGGREAWERYHEDRTAMSRLGSEAAQTLGVWGVKEAEPVLRRLIPKFMPDEAAGELSAVAPELPPEAPEQARAMAQAGGPPRWPASPQCRASAIWALGWIHADTEEDTALAAALAGRAGDVNPLSPEDVIVRWAAAVALGRMGAGSQVAFLEAQIDNGQQPLFIRSAASWAVGRITGAEPPPLRLDPVIPPDIFLRPLD